MRFALPAISCSAPTVALRRSAIQRSIPGKCRPLPVYELLVAPAPLAGKLVAIHPVSFDPGGVQRVEPCVERLVAGGHARVAELCAGLGKFCDSCRSARPEWARVVLRCGCTHLQVVGELTKLEVAIGSCSGNASTTAADDVDITAFFSFSTGRTPVNSSVRLVADDLGVDRLALCGGQCARAIR